MKFFICAYREWGLKAGEALIAAHPQHEFVSCKSPDELKSAIAAQGLPDSIFCIGWSWIIEPDVTENCWVVGVHPSDLPDYAGGSPIQNQILNGVYQTQCSLFRITPKLDGGPILGKTPISFDGHMKDIFAELTRTAILLLADYIRDYPDHLQPIAQHIAPDAKALKRIKPDASGLKVEDFSNLTTRQLYDFIRCREDPYPNAYFEDAEGRLIFKWVEFEKKSQTT